MPNLYIIRRMDGHDEILDRQKVEAYCARHCSRIRLSTRRRRTGSVDMDTPPQHGSYLPYQCAPRDTIDNAAIYIHILHTLPLLGLRRGLQGLDGNPGE